MLAEQLQVFQEFLSGSFSSQRMQQVLKAFTSSNNQKKKECNTLLQQGLSRTYGYRSVARRSKDARFSDEVLLPNIPGLSTRPSEESVMRTRLTTGLSWSTGRCSSCQPGPMEREAPAESLLNHEAASRPLSGHPARVSFSWETTGWGCPHSGEVFSASAH